MRELQQQREEQQKKKEERQRLEREYKVQFNDYLPGGSPKAAVASQPNLADKPIVMRKHDPNSKPPKIEQQLGNFSQFDRTLIKEKAVELRKKYNKGKIIHEEFDREWANLKKQYPGDLETDLVDNTPNLSHKDSPSYPPVIQPELPTSPEKPEIGE